ncbi:MAG: hypothetical protein QOH52_2370 [Pseudonocardiales bacterium]|nr:hypothetical protein [Pseudonocardiales bacterium]
MHLPGPLRAAVGVVASAAEEAKRLPDRAIELPMLAVSTALQASLRAQQRYARLAARGDAILNRRQPTDEPPPWATFDEPVPAEELRRSALAPVDELAKDPAANRMLDGLFGVADPAASTDDPPAAEATDPVAPAAAASEPETPVRKTAATKTSPKRAPAKKTPTKSAATKTPAKRALDKTTAATASPAKNAVAKKAPAKKAPAENAPAETAAAKEAPGEVAPESTTIDSAASNGGKNVSKPRHTAPSRFDNAED